MNQAGFMNPGLTLNGFALGCCPCTGLEISSRDAQPLRSRGDNGCVERIARVDSQSGRMEKQYDFAIFQV